MYQFNDDDENNNISILKSANDRPQDMCKTEVEVHRTPR